MEAENFAFWLKGYFELQDTNKLSPKQVQIIKDHLDLVFNKVTPQRSRRTKITNDFDKRPICLPNGNRFCGSNVKC